jgi:hypothetical protein
MGIWLSGSDRLDEETKLESGKGDTRGKIPMGDVWLGSDLN